jgi:hypothetical protein
MTRDPQIGGYLRPDERTAFDEYVKQFKPLRIGEVATLLVLRELKCGRLGELATSYPKPAGNGRKRVTARPSDPGLKVAFEEHVCQFGLAPDPAAATVFRAELHERWLERSIFFGINLIP